MKARYYTRDGKPIRDFLTWGKLFEDVTYKRVARTVLEDGTLISTVWLGLDHSFMEAGPPIIFETMVFSSEAGMNELDCVRYSTEAEAIIGHDAMMRKWKAAKEQYKNLSPGVRPADNPSKDSPHKN